MCSSADQNIHLPCNGQGHGGHGECEHTWNGSCEAPGHGGEGEGTENGLEGRRSRRMEAGFV